MITEPNSSDSGATGDPKKQMYNPDQFAHAFEDHLYQLILSAHKSEDLEFSEKTVVSVRNAVKSRLEVIVAGKAFVKLMLSGNAASLLLLVAFVYEHEAVSTDFIFTKILVVVSAISLLAALALTFGQFSRLSAQEQIQKWRIALCEAQHWEGLIDTWREARVNPFTKKLVSAQTLIGTETLILKLWLIGGISVILAWVLSFF